MLDGHVHIQPPTSDAGIQFMPLDTKVKHLNNVSDLCSKVGVKPVYYTLPCTPMFRRLSRNGCVTFGSSDDLHETRAFSNISRPLLWLESPFCFTIGYDPRYGYCVADHAHNSNGISKQQNRNDGRYGPFCVSQNLHTDRRV
jgi:hypothetical protein